MPSAYCDRRLLLLIAFFVSACREEEGRALRVVETVTLTAPLAHTMAIDPEGRYWLGEPGRLRVVGGERERELDLPGGAVPRIVGWMGGSAYLRHGDSIFAVPPAVDSVSAWRGDIGENPLALDVRGRAVFQGARSGAVLAHDPITLEPIVAWPALGAETTGLATSPEGDRIYQAIGSEEEPARVLIRDLQTGRVLARIDYASAFYRLESGENGFLYGIARDGRRSVVVALEPRGSELHLVWRTTLSMAETGAEVSLALGDRRLAVWGLGPRVGVRLLDAADGTVLGRTRTDPLDLSFVGGGLWALYPGELRRLE